jgi:hypothetical protein
MSYGFKIISGQSSVVESVSSDRPPGVLLERFIYQYSQTPLVKSYSNFVGSDMLPVLVSLSNLGTDATITVNTTQKTVTITGNAAPSQVIGAQNALVLVLGV